MLKLLTTAIVTIFVAASLSGQSRAQSDKEQVLDVERQWLRSISDPAVLQRILAEDFVHVLPSGVIDKRDQIQFAKTHPRSTSESRRFEELEVRIYGTVGIVNGTVVTTQNANSRRTLFTDVFVKRSGRWVAVNAQETPSVAAQ